MSSNFYGKLCRLTSLFTVIYRDGTFGENSEKFPEPSRKNLPLALKLPFWLGLVSFQVQTDDGAFISAGPIRLREQSACHYAANEEKNACKKGQPN